MVKFLKLICVCLLAWFLCPMQGDASATDGCCHFVCGGQSETITDLTSDAFFDGTGVVETFSVPVSPSHRRGEWNNNDRLLRVVRTALRFVRSFFSTSGLFWRSMDRCSFLCDARLYSLRAKLYDIIPFYPCRSVCEYYVFSLRRILI